MQAEAVQGAGKGYETRDVGWLPPLTAMGLVAVVICVGLVVMPRLTRSLTGQDFVYRSIPNGAERARNDFPAPRLQVMPFMDLQDLQRKKTELLSSYRWVDRGRGVAAVPIERAMEIVAARRSPGAAPATKEGP